jgi:DNA repair photolyase
MELSPPPPAAPRGRGAAGNPRNRFERLHVDRWDPDPEADHHEAPPDRVETLLLKDSSRSIIATNDSPDIPFDASINPYRGCEHGCIYCYARPFHEYLGFSAGLDFETRILVKEDAPTLLERELSAPRWKPKLLALSGVTDPYQPVEKRLRVTRGCLEVLARFRNPVGVITKNALVTRDADLLAELAGYGAAAVTLSVTHLDPTLSARLEPRASSPRRRLAAVRELAAAGVPVGVNVAPVVPGLTDHELPAILEAAAEAGATHAGYTLLRLPGAVEGLFVEWLEAHYPERKEKVLERVRSMRGGRLNDPRFGHRFRGGGVFAEQVGALFETTCRRLGLERRPPRLSTAAFQRPGEQLGLF